MILGVNHFMPANRRYAGYVIADSADEVCKDINYWNRFILNGTPPVAVIVNNRVGPIWDVFLDYWPAADEPSALIGA